MHLPDTLPMPNGAKAAELFAYPTGLSPETPLPPPALLEEEDLFLNQTIKEVDTLALKGTAFLLMIVTVAGFFATLILG